eukprot:Nk52_evm1s2317 gene=Nk52_evmTU1s2317
MEAVSSWLEALNLKEYVKQFEEEGFDSMYAIRELKEKDLEEMKVKRGHRRIILKGIEKIIAADMQQQHSQRGSFSGMPGGVMMPRPRTSSLTSPQELTAFTMQNTFFPQAYQYGMQHSAPPTTMSPSGRRTSIIGPSTKGRKANSNNKEDGKAEEQKIKRGKGRPSKKNSVVNIPPVNSKFTFGKMSIPSNSKDVGKMKMTSIAPNTSGSDQQQYHRASIDGGYPAFPDNKMMGKMTFNGPYNSGNFAVKMYDPTAAASKSGGDASGSAAKKGKGGRKKAGEAAVKTTAKAAADKKKTAAAAKKSTGSKAPTRRTRESTNSSANSPKKESPQRKTRAKS